MSQGRDEASLACFVAINKNASTSVRALVSSNYAPATVFIATIQGRVSVSGDAKVVGGLDEDVHAVLAAIQSRERQLAALVVNLPYGIHGHVERPVMYFAFLREPVSRCESYWHHAYRLRREGRLWSTLEAHDLNLEGALRSKVGYQFYNDQVRMISGSRKVEVGPEDYELARENIQRSFAFVGAVEDFSVSVHKVGQLLGWRDARPRYENVGRPEEKGPLPRKTAEFFREANEWDSRLHRWLTKEYLPRTLVR
jgi:hypothetical protein